MKESILSHLPREYPWADRLHCFDSIPSTNDFLKELARNGAPHGTVVIADQQTGGHGRMGRSFHSPGGMGVYMSILLRPNVPATELMHLTCATAVAMCDAVEEVTGIRPGIKWTNDLVYRRKKLGGILTELGFSGTGKAEYAIVGIGINCLQLPEDFPQEIRQIAASLSMVTGHRTDRSVLAAAMIQAMQTLDLSQKEALLQQYRADCITLGQQISLVRGNQIRYGTALDVDENGALLVCFSDGSTEAVGSGEVSIRGMYGYVL